MTVPSPCCCSLQTGTIIVAIVNICASVLFLIYHITFATLGIGIGLAVGESNKASESYAYDEYGRKTISVATGGDDDENDAVVVTTLVMLIFTILIIVMFVVHVIFSIVLLIGANQRNASKCWTWFVVTSVFLCLYVLYKVAAGVMIVVMAGIVAALVATLVEIVFFLIYVFATLYELWVVYSFVDELKRPGNSSGGQFSGVVYSVTPKQDNAEHFSQADPPPPYSPTTWTPSGTTDHASSQPQQHRIYNPASVGYPVLPVMKHN